MSFRQTAFALLSRPIYATRFVAFCNSGCLETRLPIFVSRRLQTRLLLRQQARYQSSQALKIPSYVRPGDWVCGKCQAHNFASRMICFECQSVITDGRIFYRAGDWHCPTCNLSVITQQDHCRRCMTKKEQSYEYPLSERDLELAKSHSSLHGSMKGDWTCTACGTANRTLAVRCSACEHERELSPQEMIMGDWQCPSCKAVNFAHRTKCVICSNLRPKTAAENR